MISTSVNTVKTSLHYKRNEKRPTTFSRRLTVTDGEILNYAGVFWFVTHSYVGKNCCLLAIISGFK